MPTTAEASITITARSLHSSRREGLTFVAEGIAFDATSSSVSVAHSSKNSKIGSGGEPTEM
jgi:hypothetical protein